MAIDERRREIIGKLEAAQARRNAASKEIGEAKKNKDEARAAKLDGRGRGTQNHNAGDGSRGEEVFRRSLMRCWRRFRTCRWPKCRDGADEHGNVEKSKSWRRSALTHLQPKQHFELGEALGLMDFSTTKLSARALSW